MNELKCLRCGGCEGHICINEPRISGELAWFCVNPECIKYFSEMTKIEARKKYEEERIRDYFKKQGDKQFSKKRNPFQ